MITCLIFAQWRLVKAKKMIRTPAATPLSKIRRTPSSTPGGPRVREEKILVTVRLRPLSRKEQAMYDLIAWDCMDQHTIISNNPNHERPATTYTFGMLYGNKLILLLLFSTLLLLLLLLKK